MLHKRSAPKWAVIVASGLLLATTALAAAQSPDVLLPFVTSAGEAVQAVPETPGEEQLQLDPEGPPNSEQVQQPSEEAAPAAVNAYNATNWYVSNSVGVGTDLPAHRLSVIGGPLWTSNGWRGSVELSNASAIGWRTNVAGLRFGMGHTNGGFYIFRTLSNPGTNTSPAIYDLTISDSGKVGIGTTAPGYQLEVHAPSGGLMAIYGESVNGTGIGGFAQGTGKTGVIGHAFAGTGNGVGVAARVNSPDGTAIQAENGSGSLAADIIRGCSAFLCSSNSLVFRVRRNGNVTADGSFIGGGADYADLLAVASQRTDYTPGDVLVIGPSGKLIKATTPYDTALAGVYSTQPAFVGDPLSTQGEELTNDNRVPVTLVGTVPVKASNENGPIRPGDLLTTSSIPGHAMKAKPVVIQGVEIYPTGTILGKALEPLEQDTGTIQVLLIQR